MGTRVRVRAFEIFTISGSVKILADVCHFEGLDSAHRDISGQY